MEDGIISIRWDEDLLRRVRFMLKTCPGAMRKAMRSAYAETSRSVRSYGLRLSRKEYAIAPASRNRVAAQCKISITDGEALISFTGGMGAPLRWFQASPKRAPQNWKGQDPRRRRPGEGVSVKRRTAGTRHPAYGPRGEKSFWMIGASGNVILVYRPLGTQQVSTQGLMGPSPIQAIGKAENAARIQEHAAQTMRARVDHAIDRVLSGSVK